MPQKDAGRMVDPVVCVPTASGTIQALTAAAEPLDEPPSMRCGSRGCRVLPGDTLANSVVTVLPIEMSVHEMRLGLKWHRQTFSGCRGSSVYGRNLGTSAQCSNVFPRQEEPHGRARCRDESSGRRAGSPGASAVCPGTGRHARGARSGEGHLQAVAAHWIGG